MPSPSKPTTTTTAEAKLFQTILMNLEHKPSVDWDFIAQTCGYKDAKSAQERFRQIRIRFNAKDYVDGKRSVSKPSKITAKRAAPETEVTPSPSPKTLKLDDGKSPSAARRSTLGPKVLHTTWTPANGPDMGRPVRSKAPTSFNDGDHGGSIADEALGGSGFSDVRFGKRALTPDDSDDKDAYKEDFEEYNSQDDAFEDGDKDSICSEI